MGVQGGVDGRDTPLGSAEYALNVDLANRDGSWRGIKAHSTKFSEQVDFIAKIGDGTEALFLQGNEVFHWPDTSAATVNSIGFVLSGPTCVTPDGKGIVVGFGPNNSKPPYYVVNRDWNHFGASVSDPNWKLAELTPARATSTNFEANPTGNNAAAATDVNIEGDNKYEYGLSFTYLLTSEGPISPHGVLTGSGGTYGWEDVDIVVGVQTAAIPTFATAINLYRRDYVGYGGDPGPWRFIAQQSLISASGWSAATVLSAAGYECTITDDGQIGATFEERTGLSETATSATVYYETSIIAGGKNIVGNVLAEPDTSWWGSTEGTEPAMLIASLPYRYNVFDWVNDFITLPTKPVAFAYFRKLLYAMDRNTTYVLDVSDGLIHTDTLEGRGVFGPQSVIVTDRGMFFASPNNIYLDLGSGVIPVADDILENAHDATVGWLSAAHAQDPVVFYKSDIDCFGVLFNAYSGQNYIWLFHVPTKRWSLMTAPQGTIRCSFTDNQGNVYVGVGSALYQLMSGSRYQWRFISNDVVEGLTETYYYKCRFRGNGTATLVKHENGKSLDPINIVPTSVATNTYEASLNDGPPYTSVHGFQIEFVSSNTVDEISLLRRRKRAR